MNHPKSLGSFILVAALMFFVSGCDSSEVGLQDSGEPVTGQINPYQGPTASKAFDRAVYDSVSIDDGALTWRVNFISAVFDGINTKFSYEMLKPDGGQGSHFAYGVPECANEDTGEYSYIPSLTSPTPGLNANANGDLEWSYNDFANGTDTIELVFEGNVPLGVVEVSLKRSGDGSNPEPRVITGPCNGRYTISGTVYLNNNTPEDPGNDIQDGNEPGLANVEVSLEEWDANLERFVPDASSGVVLTSGDATNYGGYSFEVLGPPLPDGPSMYRVVINNTPGSSINEELFDEDIFKVSCDTDCPVTSYPDQIYREIDLTIVNPVTSGINFGFEVNVDGALLAFEREDKISDGWERAFWRVQATGVGTKKYGPVYDQAEFESLLNCSLDGYDPTPLDSLTFEDVPPDIFCIVGSNDFGGDLVPQIFNIDESGAVAQAIQILKNDYKGKPQEALRTQILTALLNFVSGRGICVESEFDVDGTCVTFNEAAMRTFIEHAMVVLLNSGYTGPSKASPGSVGSSTELLKNAN